MFKKKSYILTTSASTSGMTGVGLTGTSGNNLSNPFGVSREYLEKIRLEKLSEKREKKN
jgi:hypothetical protein